MCVCVGRAEEENKTVVTHAKRHKSPLESRGRNRENCVCVCVWQEALTRFSSLECHVDTLDRKYNQITRWMCLFTKHFPFVSSTAASIIVNFVQKDPQKDPKTWSIVAYHFHSDEIEKQLILLVEVNIIEHDPKMVVIKKEKKRVVWANQCTLKCFRRPCVEQMRIDLREQETQYDVELIKRRRKLRHWAFRWQTLVLDEYIIDK